MRPEPASSIAGSIELTTGLKIFAHPGQTVLLGKVADGGHDAVDRESQLRDHDLRGPGCENRWHEPETRFASVRM